MSPPVIQRATLLAERGREEEAIRLLTEHLVVSPEDMPARRKLIRLYGSIGRLDAAQEQTERLAELLPPNSPVAWVELGHSYELAHRFDEALAAYDRASAIAPKDPIGPRSGGLRAARWGEIAAAEPRLAEAVRRDPRDSESWHALGVVRLGLGKLEAARQAYTEGLRADSTGMEHRLGLATVALRMNQPEQALAEYEILLDVRRNYTPAMLGKAWALILLGRLDDAERALARAESRGGDPQSISRQRLLIQDRRRQAQQKSQDATHP
jgi:tetratricopeptide (TPR) repeat protein